MTSKTWTLTPTHTLTLAPPNKRGQCHKCKSEKEISIISERHIPDKPNLVWEERKFCQDCSLQNIYQLEESNYPVENKSQIVKQIRAVLHRLQPQEQILEYYD